MASEIRLVIVDDHEVVRMGLTSLFETHAEIKVVGQAGSVQEALDVVRQEKPDVVVMDVRLTDGSGVEACREIRSELPDTRVIMLTSYSDDEALFASIMAGASGYILKQTRGRVVVEAVTTVARGGSLFDPLVAGRVLERLRGQTPSRPDDPISTLTPQERRILHLIADGKTNKEIAKEVYLSDKTVKHYVSNILQKLGLARRSEAAAFIARFEAEHGGEEPPTNA